MPRYAGYLGHEIRSPIPRTSGSPVSRSRDDGPQGSSDAGTSSIIRNTTLPSAPGRNRTCDTRFRNSFQLDPLTSGNSPIGAMTSASSSLQHASVPDVSRPFAGPPRGQRGATEGVRQIRRRGARLGTTLALGLVAAVASPLSAAGAYGSIVTLELDGALVAHGEVRSVERRREVHRPVWIQRREGDD